jgi:hypothetical protein
MATVTKDFKVKNGLIVEGTTGTINNHDILTKKTDDQNYIVNLIGGTATSANEANKVVKRDGSGNFAAGTITANLTGDVTGNADTATALETARTISLAGDVTGSVSFDGTTNVSITATIDGSFATDEEVSTAKGEAISDAASDATTKANAAQAAAEATASADATSKANAAQAAAEATASADATTKANAAQAAAEATASADATSKANAAQAAAIASSNTYTDGKVADLVDSAPELLNTLNELAAAIGDDENFATTLTASVGTKVSKAGDTMTGLLVLSADPAAALGAATKQYVDAAEADAVSTASADATTKANAAQAAAEATASADATSKANAAQAAAEATASADATSKANAAQAAAIAHADALDTDDITEGSNNLYYTNARAKAEAATLLANATKTNIVITKDGSNNLTITAENGVADSTTSDLAEGSNLYFTNARAVSALEAVTPDFPAVEIASIAKQVAAEASVATASTSTAVSWAKADYKSAEFLVKIAQGSHTEVSKVILTLDTSDNVAITEYAMVGTNGSLGSVSADVSGSDVRLRVTTGNNNSTVAVVGTLLK